MADYQSKYSKYRWTPAHNENPVFQTAPILMADPKTPHAVGAMSRGDEAGWFGVALTHRGREKKNVAKLARLHRKLLRVQQEIDEVEDKLESLGVDVDDVYEDLGITAPSGEEQDGVRPLGYEDDEEESYGPGGGGDGSSPSIQNGSFFYR